MKKKLLAVAVSTLVALPVVSLADVKIYGRANVSLDMLDNGDEYQELNLSSRSSRLGFKADAKQGNYTAFVQIESEVNFAAGGATFANRDTFVGLKGDSWGSVKIGQFDTPLKAARGPANLFGDQVGDIRNLSRPGNFDERPGNTIQYTTKDFSGLQFNVAYSLHDGTSKVQDAKDDIVSLSATYKNGGLDAALAYEAWGEDRTERDAVRLALAYKLTSAAKVVGFFQTSTHETNPANEADVFGIGAEFAVSPATAVKGMYMMRSADNDADNSMLSLGVEHKIDKQLRVSAIYAMVDNEANAFNPWNQGRTSTTPGAVTVADEVASAFSLGLRYDF